MKKHYVISLSTGEWDSWSISTLFITNNKGYAKAYCTKGNGILKKYKSHYKKLADVLLRDCKSEHRLNGHYSHFSGRADFVVGYFGFDEITFRDAKSLKIKKRGLINNN